MLEKLPESIGHALINQRAGMENVVYNQLFRERPTGRLQVRSATFVFNGRLPTRYTADGDGISPPLEWDDVPDGTESIAIIVEDADSPTPHPLVHAIVVGLGHSGIESPGKPDSGSASSGNPGFGIESPGKPGSGIASSGNPEFGVASPGNPSTDNAITGSTSSGSASSRTASSGGSIDEGALNSPHHVGAGLETGKNSFFRQAWLPPDPPRGHGEHRYVFQVFALQPGSAFSEVPGRREFIEVVLRRAIAVGCLIGTYERAEHVDADVPQSEAETAWAAEPLTV